MAHEETKDFNAMLHKDNGMPRIQRITDAASIQKYGGDKMYLAPPLAYDRLMKKVPQGQVITLGEIWRGPAGPTSPTPSRRAFLYPSPHGPAPSAPETRPPTGGP